jgi:predicted nucleic acid-binding protein
MLEVLFQTGEGRTAESFLVERQEAVHAPDLLDIEVAQVVRKFVAGGRVNAGRARAALEDFADFPLQRHPHVLLLPRIWNLGDNFTAYDACYVSLAGILDATLLTRDRRLASAARRYTCVERSEGAQFLDTEPQQQVLEWVPASLGSFAGLQG